MCKEAHCQTKGGSDSVQREPVDSTYSKFSLRITSHSKFPRNCSETLNSGLLSNFPGAMDLDMRRWILEFLLMSSIVPDAIAKKVCTVLPLPGFDSRLGKILALRSIESEVANALFTETSLECLELIEEIDYLDGTAITQAMKEAYCAVAVECSVRYLDPCPGKNARGLFDDAVNKTWRGRIRKMMEAMVSSSSGKICHLLTPELIEWKDVIESARWDAEVCERLTNMNTRNNALDKVRVYLEETRASMGPSFLESAALLSEDEGLRSSSGDRIGDAELAASIPNEGCDNSVSESALVIDQMNMCEGRLRCSINRTDEGLVVSDGNALQNAAICMEKAPETGGNQDSEQLGETDLTQSTNEGMFFFPDSSLLISVLAVKCITFYTF